VVARRGEEEPIAPTKPGPADGPTEHLKLVAKDHDFQVFGGSSLHTSQARTRRRTKAMSDRTMEVLPLPRCCPTVPGLLLVTLIPNKCTLHVTLQPTDAAALDGHCRGGMRRIRGRPTLALGFLRPAGLTR
jgi:hypothetical protein